MTVLEHLDPTGSVRRHPAGDGPVRAGITAMLPFAVGYAPFAFVVGSASAASGSPLAGWAGGWVIYGGSAQLAALRAGEVGLVAAVATGVLVQARLLAYSAALAGRWRSQPRWFRLLAAAFVVDPTWVVDERRAAATPGGAEPRTASQEAAERRFFLAAGLTLGVTWSATIGVGALVGDRLSTSLLQVAVPLCLVAVVGPRLRKGGPRTPIVVAAVVALATSGLPAGAGLLCAVVAGAAAGALPGLTSSEAEVSR